MDDQVRNGAGFKGTGSTDDGAAQTASEPPAWDQAPYEHPIDPMVDCVFKALLGSQKRSHLLVHFLNAVLKLDCPVKEVTLQDPSSERLREDDKLTIVDVRAVDERGRTFQVDVQLVNHRALAERMLFNWATLYHEQLSEGQRYEELEPVHAVWVLREPLIRTSPNYHHHFALRDQEHGICLTDHLSLHILETSKWARLGVASDSEEDDWMDLFTNGSRWDRFPNSLPKSETWSDVMSVLKRFSEDDARRREYFLRRQAGHVLASFQGEVDDARKEAADAQKEAADAQKEAADAQKELADAQVELAGAQAELVGAQQELGTVKARTKTAQQEAEAAQQEAEAAQQEAEAARAAKLEADRRAEVLAAKLRALGVDLDE